MPSPAYRRVIVKVSGEAFCGPNDFGIHAPTIEAIVKDLVAARALGITIGVVVGGGNLIRGAEEAGAWLSRPTADAMGMMGTVMNALVLEAAIERAGVHSGESACSLPPYSIDAEVQADIRRQTVALACELGVVGLMNVQFAVKDRVVYVLEVNPRASRTVPFVSKAIGVPLAKIAARCMVGRSLADQGFTSEIVPAHVSVKEAVFPFIKFPGVDTVLGPEMKSTGEVMGIDATFGAAFAKAQSASGTLLPTSGSAFVSVPQGSYEAVVPVAQRLARAGFRLLATIGTGTRLRAAGLEVTILNEVQQGGSHIVDFLRRDEVALVINTPSGAESYRDSFPIRRTALERRVPYFTTIAAAAAAGEGIETMARGPVMVRPLQEHYRSR